MAKVTITLEDQENEQVIMTVISDPPFDIDGIVATLTWAQYVAYRCSCAAQETLMESHESAKA